MEPAQQGGRPKATLQLRDPFDAALRSAPDRCAAPANRLPVRIGGIAQSCVILVARDWRGAQGRVGRLAQHFVRIRLESSQPVAEHL
jgi:hypothetical protein